MGDSSIPLAGGEGARARGSGLAAQAHLGRRPVSTGPTAAFRARPLAEAITSSSAKYAFFGGAEVRGPLVPPPGDVTFNRPLEGPGHAGAQDAGAAVGDPELLGSQSSMAS